MRKNAITIVLCVICLNAFTQNTEKSFSIYGSARLIIEKPISNYSTISFIPSIGILNTTDLNYFLFGAGGEYRYYVMGTAPVGLYAGAGFEYTAGNAKLTSNLKVKTDVNGFIGHFVIGRQWIFENGLLLNLNLGAHYLNLQFVKESSDFATIKPIDGIMPGVGVCIGYRLKSSSCER